MRVRVRVRVYVRVNPEVHQELCGRRRRALPRCWRASELKLSHARRRALVPGRGLEDGGDGGRVDLGADVLARVRVGHGGVGLDLDRVAVDRAVPRAAATLGSVAHHRHPVGAQALVRVMVRVRVRIRVRVRARVRVRVRVS